MKNAGTMCLALAAVVLTGCTEITLGDEIIHGRGPVVSEPRTVGTFTGVSNTSIADVEILQGPADRMRVRAEESILPYVLARIEGGVLRIYTDPDVILRPTRAVVVELDVRTLNRIESSGSGTVSAPLLDARRLEVFSSGSGDVRLPSLLADSIVVQHSGSGDVSASGNATRLRLTHSGSGGVDMRELQVRHADVTMSGSGSATVRVSDQLRATLSGSGGLRYWGSPTVQQSVTGSGRVERGGN